MVDLSNGESTYDSISDGGSPGVHGSTPGRARDMAAKVNQRTAESLCTIVDLWEIVAERLGITLKQAANFVEEKIRLFDFELWTDDENTGLWHPCEGKDAIGRDRRFQYLLDAWESSESANWTVANSRQWRFMKLVPSDFLMIESEALKISDASNPIERTTTAEVIAPLNAISHSDKDIDPSDLPSELDAANTAYRAVFNGYGDQSATYKNRLIAYLSETYTDLTPESVQRIATVANPDKKPGRKKPTKE